MVLILAFATLALTACSPSATPTVDANTAYTQVAGTVQTELTRSAAQAPTATPTSEPTQTQAPTVAVTQAPTVETASATPMVVFTATKPASPDKAEYLNQSVADDTQMNPGQKITWTVKNVGTSNWTTAYLLRFYSGEQMGAPATVAFPKEVKPNDTVELSLNMTAPALQGLYLSNWVLTNADGVNFYPLFIQIKVGNPPTATPTTAAATETTSTTVVPSATSGS
jgi:hypothetical protein